jgi:DNA-directed RNA polymerase II subunit RPB1
MPATKTNPYPADGDEMNAHIPQTLQSAAEVSVLSAVPKLVLSSQSSKPVMGIVQDTLCGVAEMTRRDAFFAEGQAMQLIMQLHKYVRPTLPPPAVHKPCRLWTGKQLFSLLLPDVDVVGASTQAGGRDNADPGDSRVLIQGGHLLSGVVCKKTVGTSGGGLVHVICRDHGPGAITRFFNGCQLLVNYYLSNTGFSVGAGDCRVSVLTAREIREALARCEGEVEILSRNYSMETEPKIADLLTAARDAAGRTSQSRLDPGNNFKKMVTAGSKGNPINISQITACVGQQHVEGKRIPYGFHQRTLPHFEHGDQTAGARGFVKSSYREGLRPAEFFFHAMGGREGLIDTAVKTAETGYIQRRIIKAVEDVSVTYQGTVLNSRGDIVQFMYGEDNLDGAFIEKLHVPLLLKGDGAIMSKCRAFGGVEEANRLIEARNKLRNYLDNPEEPIACPVPFKRLLVRAARQKGGADVDPETVGRLVHLLESRLPHHAHLFRLLVRTQLTPSEVCGRGISLKTFEELLEQCYRMYQQAQVHPGEMVGVLAAQSIGEPATQMTLNTFHVSRLLA